MGDSVLLWILVVIAVSSLVGVFIARRKRDICLKDFEAYLTTVRRKDGKAVWGQLAVESTGLELRYHSDYWDDDHIESSFIIYQEEFNSVFLILRFHEELSEANRVRRLADLGETYHPRFQRRMFRHVRNFFNTFRDAINQSIGAALTQVKGQGGSLSAVASQQKQVTKIQSDVVGYIGAAYDPILERHIGHMVVLEVLGTDGIIVEHLGVLKEYSPHFIEVMDVAMPDGDSTRICDILAPRAHAAVRHSGEAVATRPDVAQPPAAQAQGPSAPRAPEAAPTVSADVG